MQMKTAIENRIDTELTPIELAPQESIPATRRTRRRYWIAALALGVTLTSGVPAWRYFAAPSAPSYNIAAVRRGDIKKTISATGKVQAVTTVQVGTQVSGTVSQLYVDFNDRVKAGQVIARLDPSQIEAQLKQSRASSAASEANVASARSAVSSQESAIAASKANVDRVNAVVLDANRAYELTVNLVKEGVMAARQIQIDESAKNQALAQKAQAEAQFAQTKAQAESAKSQLEQAQAQASQSRAAVEVANVNLDRTVIRAPIDGIVVSRNVDVGQTVAASLQAPVLFLIANDLTKMQVLADIDEADVGQLSPDSKVSFTVDAFPNETFDGRISQIRLSPAVVQNVVTYTAVIDVENPKMQLRPGMTATVTAVVAEANNVLLVPNSALRFRPANTPAASIRAPGANNQKSKAGSAKASSGNRTGTVIWIEESGQLKPVRVQLGMSDGLVTEVKSESLKEDDRIATPALAQAAEPQRRQSGGSSFPGTSAPRTGRRF
jgi:HlyD family secretion protein